MYGPNYVKLSRVFAVQLFSMIIEHYGALPPVRSDPHWSHIHAITASIRLALTHALQHTLLGPITGVFEPPPPHATYQPPNHTPSTDTGAKSQGA
jgi:hypothetical protein